MVKKIAAFGLMLVMLFSLFALAGCYPERKEEQPKIAGFHFLEKAYDNGWITKTDLKSIAYYYNEGKGIKNSSGFSPAPKDPETLSVEAEAKIKQEFLDFLVSVGSVSESWKEEGIDGITILRYYGVYNDCVVLVIKTYYVNDDTEIIRRYRIGGVLFRDYIGSIRVWIENIN